MQVRIMWEELTNCVQENQNVPLNQPRITAMTRGLARSPVEEHTLSEILDVSQRGQSEATWARKVNTLLFPPIDPQPWWSIGQTQPEGRGQKKDHTFKPYNLVSWGRKRLESGSWDEQWNYLSRLTLFPLSIHAYPLSRLKIHDPNTGNVWSPTGNCMIGWCQLSHTPIAHLIR